MRSGDLSEASHMPQPPKIPWTSSSLPWTTSSSTNYTGLMEFNAHQIPINFSNPRHSQHNKRKSENKPPLPAKQFITEDKMAAHLSSLHISSDYITHHTNVKKEEPIPGPSSENNNFDTMDDDLDFSHPMTTKELEEKLKRANRITVCNEIKKLHHDSIIPQALLNRYQSPCTALVVWQPPPKISDLIVPGNHHKTYDDSDSDTEANDMDNNNSSSLDLNNYSMDTDL